MTANGGTWMMAWHPPAGQPAGPQADQPAGPQADQPAGPPPGQPHGANAFCLTSDGAVVLISPDGERWGWPGGRPEPGESWEQVLRREIAEEACATVTEARLLGFVRSRCISGHERGLVLVRSIWHAEVTLLPWRPAHEIPFRRTVPLEDLAAQLWMEPGVEPIYARALREAGLCWTQA